MAKKATSTKTPGTMSKSSTESVSAPTTTSAMTADPNIGYKLRVLLYDFRHISKDHASQRRISMTTDPLYISGPYFTADEAASLKGVIVDTWKPTYDPDSYEDCDVDIPEKHDTPMSVQETIEGCLERSFEKRRASGDSRPCGPHDMAPVYEAVFGIGKAELEEEGFLGRLRRSGLPRCGGDDGPRGQRTDKKAKKR